MNPASENRKQKFQIGRPCWVQLVQFEISVFGFQMQDSSNLHFPLHCRTDSSTSSIELTRPCRSRVIDIDHLHIRVEIQRCRALLALADAGGFHPAERDLRLASNRW